MWSSSREMERPMRYTGTRIAEYETAKIFGEPMRDVIKRLNKKERRARKEKAKREAERVAREAEAERLRLAELARIEAEREARRRQKAEEYNARRREARRLAREIKMTGNAVVDIKVNTINDDDVFRIEVVEPMTNGLEKVKNETHAYLQVSQNGKIVISELVKITGKNGTSIFWSDIWNLLSVYVGGQIFTVFDTHFTGVGTIREKEGETQNMMEALSIALGSSTSNKMNPDYLADNDTVRVVVLKADAIPSERIKQYYRDGVKHCVIEPLYTLWKQMEDNSESEASRKRCGQIARRIKSYETIYPDGVPEENMEEIAKVCHRCIIMHDIIGNEIIRYNKKSSKFFHFTNTRVNHIDTGYITMDKKYENITMDEMDKIVKEHDDNNEFYLFNGDMKNKEAKSIRSAKGAWAVRNKNHELFSEFSNSLGIKNYGIDAVKYHQLNAFVKEARLINSAPTPLCDTPNDIDDVKHIDIAKAYTQHKYSKYYKGFLGHIQQWRRLPFDLNITEFLDNHIGIFQFMVLSNKDGLLNKLGIKTGKTYTLPSPEIQYFINECGLTVRLIAGAWGSSFDIEYTPEMLENRNYCIWAGKLGMDKEFEVFTFKGNREWASHLKSVLGDDSVMYFSQEQMIIVKVYKKSYYTTHHILAFITSYTRLNMFDIMRKIDGDLVKVILDGIYFRGEIPDVEIPISEDKKLKKHIGFRDAWYYPSLLDTKGWATYNKALDGSCVLAGAGGTGKSYSVLTDKGFINPLYVVPSHLLGRKCRQKYGCNYTTINKLIGMDCRSFKDTHYEPATIFIDELTMIEGEWIEKAIHMYPNSLMFIAGDIDEKQWFQCRNGHPGQFSSIWIPGEKWRYVYYTNDMRSKDEELKAFKMDIRREMKAVFTDGNQMDAVRINYYVKKNYKTVPFEEAVKMFQPGDYWIAGTHKTNEKLLERGVVSGYINKNKEIVQEDEVGAVKRGSFTTHSFQGLTIETERLFVSLDFFEYAMLYTSISRVCNFNQIVLVN